MVDWRYGYHPQDLNYLSRKAQTIDQIAALLGIPPLGLAGGSAREMTLERYGYGWFRRAAQPLKELLTTSEPDESGPNPMTNGPDFSWKPITHDTIADYFDRSNMLSRDSLGNPKYTDRL